MRRSAQTGIEVIPVWNKSNREHNIIGSEPASTRAAADAAVKALGWKLPYFCDADHINLQHRRSLLAPCDFFTIDVADFIGQPRRRGGYRELREAASGADWHDSAGRRRRAFQHHRRNCCEQTAQKFLAAVKKAGEVYRRIEARRARATSSPKFRWTRRIARRTRPSC